MFFPAYKPDPFSLTADIGMGIICFIFLFTFIAFCTFQLVMFFLPKRFDPKFGADLLGYGKFIKSSWYAAGVAAPKWLIRKNSGLGRLFKGYDLWGHATKFERVISSIFFYSSYISILFILIYIFDLLIYYIRIWIS
ncbi:MAG: hypothetical protein JSR33_03535 [Proteobacteria bacterium]|nr:hypothetical protein [Pseudomonadota bacterium]